VEEMPRTHGCPLIKLLIINAILLLKHYTQTLTHTHTLTHTLAHTHTHTHSHTHTRTHTHTHTHTNIHTHAYTQIHVVHKQIDFICVVTSCVCRERRCRVSVRGGTSSTRTQTYDECSSVAVLCLMRSSSCDQSKCQQIKKNFV